MKLSLILAAFSLSSAALACPALDFSPALHTDVAVSCAGDQPNFIAPATVFQIDPSGKVCNVQAASNSQFYVRGRKLVQLDKAGHLIRQVGALTDDPYCQEVDSGEHNYMPSWTAVNLQP